MRFNRQKAIRSGQKAQSFGPESLPAGTAFTICECSAPIKKDSESKSCTFCRGLFAVSRFKVVIAAGGSGGHVLPAAQLAALLKENHLELTLAGHGLKKNPFIRKEGHHVVDIVSAPLKNPLRFCLFTLKGFFQSLYMLIKIKPKVVVGFGSYHSFPVLLAAAVLRKKIVLYEANCVMGKVNRLFYPLSTKLALQFPLVDRKAKKAALIPFFPWVKKRRQECSSTQARERLGLKKEALTFLVFGGSQGASFLNKTFPKVAGALKRPFQVIHLTGNERARGEVEAAYKHLEIDAHVRSFDPEMNLLYSAADFVICRSGAGTIAELIGFCKPALLIPFPAATDEHQRKNAEFLSNTVGGSLFLLQKNASVEVIAKKIEVLMNQKETLALALRAYLEQNEGRAGFCDLVSEVGESS